MKKKLLAIIATVAMIATLLVPMFSVSAADPKVVIGFGDITIDGGELVVPVEIVENTGDIFVAKFILAYDDELECTYYEEGTIEDEYDSGRGGMKKFGFSYTPNTAEASVTVDSNWTSLDVNGECYGVTTTGNIGTFYFARKDGVAITDASAYAFGVNPASEVTSFDTSVHPTVSLLCKHTATEEVVVSEPECGVKGEKKEVCTACGEDVKTGIEIPALEHVMVRDPENDVTSGCGQPGKEAYKCERGCGHTETKDTAALDHAWEVVSETKADCENDGVKVEKCSRDCGVANKETVTPALGHDWVEDAENSVEPDCENDGYIAYKCSRDCGETKEEPVDALGHDFTGDVTIVKEATLEEKGELTIDCVNGCGEVESVEIPELVTGIDNDEMTIKVLTEDKGIPADTFVAGGLYDDMDVELVLPEGVKEITGFAFFTETSDEDYSGIMADITLKGEEGDLADYTDIQVGVVDLESGEITIIEDGKYENGNLSFNGDIGDFYVILGKEIPKSPATADSFATVAYAAAAIMAVAALVVIGKKRFAL